MTGSKVVFAICTSLHCRTHMCLLKWRAAMIVIDQHHTAYKLSLVCQI